MIETVRILARYNRLANERLYAVCASLPEVELKRDRSAFFKSIHGTLNHIMVGDRIWLARFEGREIASSGLDVILYPEFDALHSARVVEDARIEAFAAAIDEGFLERSIRYHNHQGQLHVDPAPLLLLHLFNHQTHHRGQVHDQLTQSAVAPPSLDLHRVLRPDAVAADSDPAG